MKSLKVNKEGIIKVLLSISLLIYSIYLFGKTGNYLIACAMLFSSIGDIMIMSSRGVFNSKKPKNFIYGPVFFGMAHITYIASMVNIYTANILMIDSILILTILFVVFFLNKKESTFVNASYAVILISNLINCYLYGSIIAVIGMVFFIISDAILSIKEKDDPIWQIPVWVTYVIAQILLLSSFIVK